MSNAGISQNTRIVLKFHLATATWLEICVKCLWSCALKRPSKYITEGRSVTNIE